MTMDYGPQETRRYRKLLRTYLTSQTPATIDLADPIQIGTRKENVSFLLYELAGCDNGQLPPHLRHYLHLDPMATYETAIAFLQHHYGRIEEALDLTCCGFCHERPVMLVRAWGITLDLCVTHSPERLEYVPSESGSTDGPCELCGKLLTYDRLFFCGQTIAVCEEHLHALQRKVQGLH
jgi:hypothetical protein